jgi:hypothetical protein
MRFKVLTAATMKFRVFWDVASCSHVEDDRISEAARTSETSVNLNMTTRRYIPEDSKLRVTINLLLVMYPGS